MSAFTIVGDGPWSDALREDTDEQGKPQAVHLLSTTVSTTWADGTELVFLPFPILFLPNSVI